MKWYPRGCPVCRGDLHDDLLDAGWVTCFMCARSFRTTPAPGFPRLLRATNDVAAASEGVDALAAPELPRSA